MMPTTPSGSHCSIMRWPGRSLAIVRPCSWRDRPTANSQMSIISWTSPRPSLVTLPASMDTSCASWALWARSSSPNRRTSSPRFGAGTTRQALKASCARPMAACMSAALAVGSCASTLPSMGERTLRSPEAGRWTPRASSTEWACCFMAGILGNRLDLAALLVGRAEAVGEEVRQGHLFLADEALLRQLACAEQVHRGADARGGGDLDGRQRLGAIARGEDLAGEDLLQQHAVLHARDGHEHQHHVLHRGRHALAHDGLEVLLVALQAQVAEQELHQVAVAGVAHGLVVEVAHLARPGLAQRAQAAGGVEGLVLGAVQAEMLQAFQRQGRDELAAVDGFAGVAVLVDQAVDRPGQVVLELVGREGRQRTDAHLHIAHFVELAGQVVGDDADEARRQAALRHEGGLGALGHLHDGLGGGHVLGQVEVVAAALQCQLGGRDGQVVGQRIDDRVLAAQLGGQRGAVVAVHLGGGNALGGQHLQVGGALVKHGHLVVAGGVQQAGDGLADVAGAEQGDLHGVLRRDDG
mmetsp:Transcript_23198/g.54795  ORF Transcript_23198/g.54795 Transcript_23198/m.54795 type:complete len:524 (+) Transcript_23198:3704-5275(+)